MTVKQLIDFLNNVEDKDQCVWMLDNKCQCSYNINNAIEIKSSVIYVQGVHLVPEM